jgi:uncharacterized protein YgiM (DUF1202 family)
MKRYGLILGILILGTIAGRAEAQSSSGRTLFVSTRTAELKSSTGFFADTLATLEYGDQVTVLQENGRWTEVRLVKQGSISGWIQSGSLTSKRIVNTGGSAISAAASASANELALAGKGFSEEVENSYKQSYGLDYTAIDVMESQEISRDELYQFLVEGHLRTGEN